MARARNKVAAKQRKKKSSNLPKVIGDQEKMFGL